ncbi:MAG: hydrogenase formation protein HypD [Firmicutes bacterium]|nr:hydrogenase formation protein HypD [Bacillota bacterium]
MQPADLRSPQKVAELLAVIRAEATRLLQPLTVMEVCGTHTMSIARYGLKQLLPPQVQLISGPGCPVCVTPADTIAAACHIASLPGVLLTGFGDMMRVPAGSEKLLDAPADKVQVVLSPLDALRIAEEQPQLQVVFFAVGFETTAPLTAVAVQEALRRDIRNFSVLNAHKTMPQALRALLPGSRATALLCPGHVAAITGADSFSFVADELGFPSVVAGFEPVEILQALLLLVRQQLGGKAQLQNAYAKVVRPAGNPVALQLLDEVFSPCTAAWRGLGEIAGSGLAFSEKYQQFDALARFAVPPQQVAEPKGCRCANILRGELSPQDCPLFGKVCLPQQPVGPCMVSEEGACAAAWRYGGVDA